MTINTKINNKIDKLKKGEIMSKCGYFSVFKGKVSCKHPNDGDTNTKLYTKNLNECCKFCRKRCGGIYPTQLPRADQSNWQYEVIDADGKVLMTY